MTSPRQWLAILVQTKRSSSVSTWRAQGNIAVWTVHVYRENKVCLHYIHKLGTDSLISRITSTAVVVLEPLLQTITLHRVHYQICTETVTVYHNIAYIHWVTPSLQRDKSICPLHAFICCSSQSHPVRYPIIVHVPMPQLSNMCFINFRVYNDYTHVQLYSFCNDSVMSSNHCKHA